MSSLYQRIGGDAALNAAVEEFYRRIIADADLAPVFASTDMQRLKSHQRRFLALAFGGPNAYGGRDLRSAHAPITQRHGLGHVHFDAVIGHLVDTLDALGVDPHCRDEAIAIAESTRCAVLNLDEPAAAPARVAAL